MWGALMAVAIEWLPATIAVTIIVSTMTALLSRIASHSISWYGRRVEAGDGTLEYRIALQNNESVAIVGALKLTIRIVDGRGAKIQRLKLYAGPTRFSAHSEQDTLSVKFNEIPAHDAWFLVFTTNRRACGLELRLSDENIANRLVSSVFANRAFYMPPDVVYVSTARRRFPGLWLKLSVVGSTYLLYLCFVASLRPVAGPNTASLAMDLWGLPVVDHVVGLAIVSLGLLLGWVSSVSVPPTAQGYWNPSEVSTTIVPSVGGETAKAV